MGNKAAHLHQIILSVMMRYWWIGLNDGRPIDLKYFKENADFLWVSASS